MNVEPLDPQIKVL